MYPLKSRNVARIAVTSQSSGEHRPVSHRTSPLRLTRGTAAAALLAALLVVPAVGLASTGTATAAEIPSAVTSATLSRTTFGPWDGVRLDIGWAVPDTAQPGDTFTVDLPRELVPVATTPFDLRSPDGTVVAHAVWEGSTAVVTLTDYVQGRTGVTGTGYFEVQWDVDEMGTDPVTTVLVIAGKSVTVTMTGPGDGVPSQEAGKWAYWNRPDQGTTNLEQALTWEVRLPAAAAGIDGPVTVADHLGAGQAMVCSSVAVVSRTGDPGSPVTWFADSSPERVLSLDCDDDGLTVVLDAIRPDEYVSVIYTVDITQVGLAEYSNVAEISTTTDSTEVGAEKVRSDAGGDGSGTVSVPPTTEPTDPTTTPGPTVTPDPVVTPEPTDPGTEPAEPTSPVSTPAPSTPATVVPPAPGGSGGSVARPVTSASTGARLASTGTEAGALATTAALLLGVGGVVVWSLRRRSGSAG